jgi:TATA-box binding protein (TBP) (component of TFIID and TFIIIB)
MSSTEIPEMAELVPAAVEIVEHLSHYEPSVFPGFVTHCALAGHSH